MGNEQKVISGEISLKAADFIHNPPGLREFLHEHDALRFTPYPTGMFPASYLSDEVAKATKMDMAWIRDNAHILRALLADGQIERARGVGQGFLQVLENNRDLVDAVGNGSTTKRFPVRFDGKTLANDTEDRRQNDSVGYLLWGVAPLLERGVIKPDSRILDNLTALMRYVETIQYWQDYDQGHWEEDFRLHGTSVGAVMAGIRDTQSLFESLGARLTVDADRLFELGDTTLRQLEHDGVTDYSRDYDEKYWTGPAYPDDIDLDDETKIFFNEFDIHRRRVDAAMMFLVEPLNIITGDRAMRVVTDIDRHLRRERGHARYIGDTYWMPGYKSKTTAADRTHDAIGRLEWRNQFAAGVALMKAEAQWTLDDPLAATFWGKRQFSTTSESDLDKFLDHFNRSLSQFVKFEDGTLGHPENHYYEIINGRRILVHNDHTPLLWPRANFLQALRMFETIFAKTS